MYQEETAVVSKILQSLSTLTCTHSLQHNPAVVNPARFTTKLTLTWHHPSKHTGGSTHKTSTVCAEKKHERAKKILTVESRTTLDQYMWDTLSMHFSNSQFWLRQASPNLPRDRWFWLAHHSFTVSLLEENLQSENWPEFAGNFKH